MHFPAMILLWSPVSSNLFDERVWQEIGIDPFDFNSNKVESQFRHRSGYIKKTGYLDYPEIMFQDFPKDVSIGEDSIAAKIRSVIKAGDGKNYNIAFITQRSFQISAASVSCNLLHAMHDCVIRLHDK